MTEAFLTAFATLFVMIDPIGVTPIFAALTSGRDLAARARIALVAVLVAGGLLALFGLLGDTFLRTIGVSLPAFRIAGGALLFLLSVEMVFQKRAERRDKTAQVSDENDPSVFPLATPLVAGPGAMATMMLLIAQFDGDMAAQTGVFAAMAAVLLICFTAFLATDAIERVLGKTGILVLTRLFGMLLGALAVQFILDGVFAYVAAL